MKKISIILFIAGLLMEISAFLIGNAPNVPWVYAIISKDYYNAVKAKETLISERVLNPKDEGFHNLIRLFREEFNEDKINAQIDTFDVLKFEKKTARLSFSRDHAHEVIPVEVQLSNGQSVKWSILDLNKSIESLRSSSIFAKACVIFFLGVMVQVIGFLIEKTYKQGL